MKKYILFAVMTALFPSMAVAQLRVMNTGRVMANAGLFVTSSNSTGTDRQGIMSYSTNTSTTGGKSIGIHGMAKGIGGNTYGIVGRTMYNSNSGESNFGTGILGIAPSINYSIPYIAGYYAGYWYH